MKFSRPRTRVVVVGVATSVVLCVIITTVAAFLVVNRPKDSNKLNTFGSCQDIASWLRENNPYVYYYGRDDVSGPMPAMEGDSSTANGGKGDSSQTNVQVQGVDESDTVKNDGRYIYTVISSGISIVDTRSMQRVAIIKLDYTPSEIYLYNKKLIALIPSGISTRTAAPDAVDMAILPNYYTNKTELAIYDVTNPAVPKKQMNLAYDGQLLSSRINSHTLYLASNVNNYYYQYSNYATAESVDELLPTITITGLGGGKDIDGKIANCDQVKYYGSAASSYVHVLGVNLDDLGKVKAEVVMGSVNSLYMSKNNLYLAAAEYNTTIPRANSCDFFDSLVGGCGTVVNVAPESNQVHTAILRYKLQNDEFNYVASGKVEGIVLNQFSMDENSGYLRVATTKNTSLGFAATSNNLVVLDENMQQVGSVENLAKGETIYAVRYIDDRAYIVTFRQTDPLFVIDLSNPREPKLLGQLKITGYSSYLHPFGKNKLIGVGREATTGGSRTGLKVAIFDATDPAKPEVLSTVEIGDKNTGSEVISNHKVFYFDEERGMLVIPVTDYDYTNIKKTVSTKSFQVINVTPTTLKLGAVLATVADENYTRVSDRIVRAGDKLYTLAYTTLQEFSLPGLQSERSVNLVK